MRNLKEDETVFTINITNYMKRTSFVLVTQQTIFIAEVI